MSLMTGKYPFSNDKERMTVMVDKKAGKTAEIDFQAVPSSVSRGAGDSTAFFMKRNAGKIKRTPEGVLLSTHCGVTEVTI